MSQLADAPKRQDQINDDDHQHHLTKNAQVSMQQQAEQGAQCQPEERQSPQHHCSHQQQQQQLHHHLQLHHNQQQHSISPQVGVSGRQLQQQVMQQLQFQQILRLQCSPQQQVPALLQQPAGVTVLQRPNTQLLLSKQQPCQLYTAHMPSLQAGMSTALTANMQAPAGLGVSSSLVSPGMRVLVAAPPCAAPALLPATDTASNFNSSSKTLAPALRQAAEQQSLDVQQQQQQQQQLVPAASAEGVRLNGNAEGGMSTAQGCTCKLGSHQALTQVCLVPRLDLDYPHHQSTASWALPCLGHLFGCWPALFCNKRRAIATIPVNAARFAAAPATPGKAACTGYALPARPVKTE
jgi:hypothetical protein